MFVLPVDMDLVTDVSASLFPLEPSELPFDFTIFPSEGPSQYTETPPTYNSEPKRLGLGLGDNLIPLYASIVPAVLLGLVAFIVIKR